MEFARGNLSFAFNPRRARHKPDDLLGWADGVDLRLSVLTRYMVSVDARV
jgi:hypothetical protein